MSVESRLQALEKQGPSKNRCPVCGGDNRVKLVLLCPQPDGTKGPECGHLVLVDVRPSADAASPDPTA